MSQKLQPALFGGLFIGVLSSLPFVSGLNACCCVWVVAGGLLTTYLLQERLSEPVTTADAAVAGLLAGVIGAVLAGLLGIVFAFIQGTGPEAFDQIPQGDLPPEVARVFEQLRTLPPAFWYIAPFVMFIVLFPIFALLGALLGVAIFKRTPPPPPPGTVEVLPPEQPPM